MSGFFEIRVEKQFSAAHFLRGYQGDCALMHGHNWIVQAYVKCKALDEIGIGIDFRKVKEALKEVIAGLDHRILNEVPAFTEVNPTSENLARFLYKELSARLNVGTVSVSKVWVFETPGAGAGYWEE
jgi:6-pyruvoyltetrahydropterin/6-carboxytetrahydropterin synthase